MLHNLWGAPAAGSAASSRRMGGRTTEGNRSAMRSLVGSIILLTLALPVLAQTSGPTDTGGHWAEERIALLLRRGITQPFPDQTFRPEEPIGRAELLRWIVTATGITVRTPTLASFIDVPPYHPAAPFVETALAQGIIPRAPAFLPENPVTRIDAVLIAVRT